MIEYSDEEPVLKATAFNHKEEGMPETVILTWQCQIVEAIERKYNMLRLPQEIGIGGIHIPVFVFEDLNPNIGLCILPMGSPVVAYVIEALNTMGAKRIVAVGSCGVLSDRIKASIFVPMVAFRDEGTSFHYIVSMSDYIRCDDNIELTGYLSEHEIVYDSGITWTTDAIYRETPRAISTAKAKGCVVVDMECSCIMAVATSLKMKAYQLFYTGDVVKSSGWNENNLLEGCDYPKLVDIVVGFAEKITM